MDHRSTAAEQDPAFALEEDEAVYPGLAIRHRNRLDTETRRHRRRADAGGPPLRRVPPLDAAADDGVRG
jgi:hypothetical protein